ncbi:unnamed protein product [Blepharisma stoltei]|uniref:Uncharacterized protein n=1 Tax=Blepharisma stoltei TaxID=1481888 RepID=A0AAU9I9F0_9CILI|nr:unnamed protein product [Blepharisma stoltei]
MSYSCLFKFIIIGETSVGKSCLMLSFTDKKFRQQHDLTLGVEFGTKIMELEGEKIKLQLWDTAGSEKFRSVTRSYYRAAAGALLVFDITRRDTFNRLSEWLNEARLNGNPSMTVMLVGNKIDLNSQREVTYEEANKFAMDNNLLYAEASAKTGVGVREAFVDTAKAILKRINEKVIDTENKAYGITVKKKQETKEIIVTPPPKKQCCM